MIYKIEWHALVGQHFLHVSSTELIEAENSTTALNTTRTSIITKLCSLNSPFYMQTIKFINIGFPITISIADQYQFLNSLNDEGGLLKNVPSELPLQINCQKNPEGDLTLAPIYKAQEL